MFKLAWCNEDKEIHPNMNEKCVALLHDALQMCSYLLELHEDE